MVASREFPFMPAALRRSAVAGIGLLLIVTGGTVEAQGRDAWEADRTRMVHEIARLARATGRETGRPVLSERVMTAMRRVPRHEFVPASVRAGAYDDRPLSIGEGQTISQPFIVALMTDLLEVQPRDRVLEIGTGSGYQAAVLAALAATVYTVEISERLAGEARERFERLGLANVVARTGDGYQGWAEHAPFDAIMVTAAPREVPQTLIDQLKPGGRMVVPVGGQLAGQSLLLIEKGADGGISRRTVLSVRFVPLRNEKGRQQ